MTYYSDPMKQDTDHPPMQSATDTSAATSTPLRLLAIDDVTDSAELIARIAQRSGYETRYTCDPTSVAGQIREWHPDVVVTDISMPGMDAIELVRMLGAAGFHGKLLIVSGLERWLLDQAAKIASSFGLQVAARMQKPVDVGQLRNHLNAISSGT